MKVMIFLPKSIFAAIAALSLSCTAATVTSRVAYTDTPPVIDGVLDDAAWDRAAVLPPYTGQNAKLMDRQEETYLLYDNENIYVGFRTVIDFDLDVAFTPMAKDSVELVTVDAFSMSFAKPDALSTLFQFNVERGGGTAECYWDITKGLGSKDFSWNGANDIKVSITPGAFLTNYIWEVEAAIPWATLEMTPEAGLEIAAQFIHYKGKGEEYGDRATTWDPYDNPWGLLGFGGRLFLAAPGQPVFRFEGFDGFLKGSANIRGSFTEPFSGGTYFNVTLEDSSAPMNTHGILSNVTEVEHKGTLPIAGAGYGTGQWFITDNSDSTNNGVAAGGFFKTDWSQAFSVRINRYYYGREIVFQGDLQNLDYIPDNAVVRCTLISKDEKVFDTLDIPAVLPGFEVRLSCDSIPAGTEYTAEALLLDGEMEIAAVRNCRTHEEDPEWLDFEGGKFDTPDPATGWLPLEYSQKGSSHTVKVLENTASFSPQSVFPAELNIAGDALIASPMRFIVETDKGSEVFENGKITLAEENGRGVTLFWEGCSESGLKLFAEILAEFDGLIYYDLAIVTDDGPVIIKKAAIEIPIAAENAMYLRSTGNGISNSALIGAGQNGQEIPRIAISYELNIQNGIWDGDTRFAPFYWLGNDKGGIYGVLPSERNIFVNGKYNTLTETTNELLFTINLIDNDTLVESGVDWELCFIMTPSKRPVYLYDCWKSSICYSDELRDNNYILTDRFTPALQQHPMAHRFFGWDNIPPMRQGEFANFGIQQFQTQIGNPYPPQNELDSIKSSVDEFKNTLGSGALLWYDGLFTTIAEPAVAPYAEDIERNPRKRLQVEHFGSITCGSPAWANMYLMGVQRFMDIGVRSFYMDLTAIQYCNNRIHDHGWYNADGKLQQEISFLDVREMFLRYQHLIKGNDPRAVLMLHSSSDTPLILYCDATTYGEELSLLTDYRTLSPEYFRMYHTGWKQFGVPTTFFAPLTIPFYGNAPASTVTYEETWGLSLVHGESVYAAMAMHLPSSRLVWDALEEFGVEDGKAEWIPYWRNQRNQYPGGVLVSSFRKDCEEMLVIFNNSYDESAIPDSVYEGLADITDLIGTAPEDLSKIKARGFYLLKGKI